MSFQDWDREQFLTYILLYAANADQRLSDQEEDFITNGISQSEYEEIKGEFDSDSDKERVDKIIGFSHDEEFDQEYMQVVMNDIEELFLSDGEYTQWEKAIGRSLKRIMNM